MTYIRWLLGLQYACPVKKLFLPWPRASYWPKETRYHARRLFYIVPGRENQVAMLDLEAGKRLIWTNRTPIHTFRISDQYLFTVAING